MSTPSFNDYKIMEMSTHRSGTLRDVSLSDFSQLLAEDTDDDNITTSIEFPFTFEGESYTTLNVTTNGVVQLVGDGTTLLGPELPDTWISSQLSSQEWADPVFAPWWSDLITAGAVHRGGVYKHTRSIGFAGHQETIIRFICYSQPAETSADARLLIFEVVINSLGGIAFNYAPMITVGSPGFESPAAAVGIGMKSRQTGITRYKIILGPDFDLTATDNWPMAFNNERSYLMTPPYRLVVSSSPVTNVRTTR